MNGVFVHERALVESDVIGEGTRVWAFAHVMKGAVVGRGCNIGDHAFIERGARLGDQVTVKNNVLIWDGVTLEDGVFAGPNVVFTNDPRPRVAFKDEFKPVATVVKKNASIGANATIICGVTLGEWSFVGAGSVVTRDVPAHGFVLGSPARQIGWACDCARRLPESLRCSCGRAYREENRTIVRLG